MLHLFGKMSKYAEWMRMVLICVWSSGHIYAHNTRVSGFKPILFASLFFLVSASSLLFVLSLHVPLPPAADMLIYNAASAPRLCAPHTNIAQFIHFLHLILSTISLDRYRRKHKASWTQRPHVQTQSICMDYFSVWRCFSCSMP